MSLPKLPLKDSKHTTVFRALVKVLHNDPTLRKVVKTWRVWDGSTSDSQPIATGNLPVVRLTPEPHAAHWESVNQQRMDLVVRVETGVNGTNADDSMNLWAALYAPLYRPAGEAALRAAGVFAAPTLIQPAFGVRHQTNRLIEDPKKDVEDSGLQQILVAGLILFPIAADT